MIEGRKAEVKPPPTSFFGEVDTGKGNPLERNRDSLDPTENFCLSRLISEKSLPWHS